MRSVVARRPAAVQRLYYIPVKMFSLGKEPTRILKDGQYMTET